MLRKQKKAKAPITAGWSYTTLPDAHGAFRKKMPKRTQVHDAGTNDFLEVFLKAIECLLSAQQAFTFADVHMLLRTYQIPNEELRSLFDRWANHMEQMNKLEKVNGCYDELTYVYH